MEDMLQDVFNISVGRTVTQTLHIGLSSHDRTEPNGLETDQNHQRREFWKVEHTEEFYCEKILTQMTVCVNTLVPPKLFKHIRVSASLDHVEGRDSRQT